MIALSFSYENKLRALDVCKVCQLVWFDPKEYEEMPPLPPSSEKLGLPPDVRQTMAIERVVKAFERADHLWHEPEEGWQKLMGFLGFPIETNEPVLRGRPLVTWGLAFLVTFASLYGFTDMEKAVGEFALIPERMWRGWGMTFLTSFFIHGGATHLLGNIYFFLAFGDNVEDYLGRWYFFLLLVAATLAAGVFHAGLDPRPRLPMVGASGGISGIILFYALQFPHAKLGFFVAGWTRISCRWAVVFWVLIQLLGALNQSSGLTSVSHLAHLGGALAGIFFWLLFGYRGYKLDREPIPKPMGLRA
jgi:membrane associated rhomboid family serine protease